LIEPIARGDDAEALRRLAAEPALARAVHAAPDYFVEVIRHYVYAGDTALHLAAAAYRVAVVRRLVELGADVRARNRRGAEPIHYAVDGGPGAGWWDPDAQAAVVAALVAAGADPNAEDKDGVAPLHRAVRCRSTGAVRALLAAGADARRKSGRGSTPLELARMTTGRGGSGSPEAKAEQRAIIALLTAASARR
jgi:ankyrin repeat protein